MGTGDEWSFRCTACGKCCDSGPELSVPELFRHQHRFIGRLAVRRVRRPAPATSPTETKYDLLLVTHAWHDETLRRCPALADDGRCTLQGENKPLVCSLAPLDALVPDAGQHLLLSQRAREATYWQADCIVPGARPGFLPLVRRLAVVDPDSQRALARRRAELVLEKRFWGAGVFRLLEPDLFARPDALAKIPADGFMSLSLAPVLMVLAETSLRCRERCLEYLDAQLVLARRLGLADVVRTHAALSAAFRAGDVAVSDGAVAAATETWLGLERAA
jgi:Fe-S-cluster containining protein